MVINRRARISCAATLAVAALAPAAAEAQAPQIQLSPNVAGKQSQLSIDGSPSSGNGQDVRGIVVSIVRGLKVDPRSRAQRCTPEQASGYACPEGSRIGKGEAKGHASGLVVPGGRQDFTATIDAFLAPPKQAGDIAGVVLQVNEPSSGTRGTTTGRIVPVGGSGPFGAELRFDDFGSAQPQFPGVTITIDRITLQAGAKRTVVRKRRVRRHGKRVTVKKRYRYSLLTNPRSCNGSWPFQITVIRSDGADKQDASADCTPASAVG